MATLSRNVIKLLSFGFENDLEIVSYGLAPNPFGFCFESHGKASERAKQWFSRELECLSASEIKEVRKAMANG